MVSIDDILIARTRIAPYVKETPLYFSRYLSELVDAKVYLKLENKQLTGSFKVRGALNKMLNLTPEELSLGVITASTGNHAQGFGFAARELKVEASVVFPKGASEHKKSKIQEYGVKVIQDVGYDEIEPYARKLAKELGMTYVSPYNDPLIVTGAGTTGLEILEQTENIDQVIVPVGGGGLISGIAIAIKNKLPDVEIIGVQSEASPEIYKSWRAGHWVEAPESDSLAQGLMGGVEADSITLDIIQEKVTRMTLVRESSILNAMKLLYEKDNLVIEGAGAISTAELIEHKEAYEDKNVVVVVSGGNIQTDELISLIQ